MTVYHNYSLYFRVEGSGIDSEGCAILVDTFSVNSTLTRIEYVRRLLITMFI